MKYKKEDIYDIWPLTPVQESMLRRSETINKGEREYYGCFSFYLHGEIDVQHFTTCWKKLIDAHEVLRLVFVLDGVSEPLQLVTRGDDSVVSHINYRGMGKTAESAAREIIRENHLPKLEQASFHVKLISVADDSHVMFLFNHHAIFDGWSLSILFKQFMSLYTGQIDKIETISFRHYIERSRTLNYHEMMTFWTNHLENLVVKPLAQSSHDLTDNSMDTDQHSICLSIDRLCSASAQLDVSLPPLLYAAWGICLLRLTNTTENVFGITVSTRNEDMQGIAYAVGLYINTIPMRIYIDAKTTTHGLVLDIKNDFSKMMSHLDYPFDDIARTAPNHSLPINSLVVIENYPIESILADVTTLQLTKIEHDEKNNFDLTLLITLEDKITVRFAYKTSVFCKEFIHMVAEMYNQAISEICIVLERPIQSLDFLLPERRNWLLSSSLGQIVEYPDCTVDAIFDTTCHDRPQKIAITDDRGNSFTYSQMKEKSNAVAEALITSGVKSGDFVGIICKRCAWMIVGILAIIKAGAAYLPIDATYPLERAKTMISDADARCLLVDMTEQSMEFGNKLSGNGRALCIIEEASAGKKHIPLLKRHDSSSIAYLLYTSGSTGTPKGVLIRHGSIVNRLYWMAANLNLNESVRILQKTPFTFDVSVWEILLWFFVGGSCHVLSNGLEKEPKLLLDSITENGITLMHFVPSMLSVFLEYLDDHPVRAASFPVRDVIASGEALNPATAERFYTILDPVHTTLHNYYGPTEATIDVTFHKCISGQSPLPIGRPIQNNRIYIIDNAYRLMPQGAVGKLMIAGVGLAAGYHGKPELTARKFLPDPFVCGELMYDSGDEACWDEEGQIIFCGRSDSQVKIRGVRVEIDEIVRNILGLQGVTQAAVLPVELGQDAICLVAFIVANHPLDEMKTRAYLSAYLTDVMLPHHFIQIENLPITKHGKLDHYALKLAFQTRLKARYDGDQQEHTDELYQQLKHTWMEILDISEMSNWEASFFELGGDSLRAARLANRVTKLTNKEVLAAHVMQNPTLRQLYNVIAGAQETATEPTVSLAGLAPASESYPTSSMQRRLYFLHELCQRDTRYNIFASYRIEGHIYFDRLSNALTLLVDRHEALRTCFLMRGDELVQVIQPKGSVKIDDILTKVHCEYIDKSQICAQIIGFDLTKAPLFRIKAFITDEQHCVLTFDIHHIIADGLSVKILLEELTSIYNNIIPDPPKATYMDYVYWQNMYEKSGHKSDLTFWTDMFTDVPPVLDLPLDKPRPPVFSGKGATLKKLIPKRVWDEIKTLAECWDTSVFSVLLASYYTLLWKICRQDEIVVGIPVSQRNHEETENIIGLFIDTYPLHISIDPAVSFKEFHDKLKHSWIIAMEHQSVSFDEIVDGICCERNTDRNPLFDTMFVYQPVNMRTLHFNGLAVDVMDCIPSTAQFDVSMILEERGQDQVILLEYCSDLFYEESMQIIIDRYLHILSQVSSHPDTLVYNLSMFLDGERDTLLLFSGQELERPKYNESLINVYEKWVQNDPTHTAVIDSQGSWSYAQLDEYSHFIQSRLSQIKSAEAGPVLLCFSCSKLIVAAIVAVMCQGGCFVPLDTSTPLDRLLVVADELENVIILTDEAELHTAFQQTGYDSILLEEEASHLPVPMQKKTLPSMDDTAYIVYTSGSTGRPKGVKVHYAGLQTMWLSWQKEYNLSNHQPVLLQLASFSFDVFIGDVIRSIFFGGTMVICAQKEKLDLPILGKLMQQYRVTLFESTPGLVIPLMEYLHANQIHIPDLELLIMGSDICPADEYRKILKRYGMHARVINSYGASEATIDTCYYEESYGSNLTRPHILPIGKPMHLCQVYVLTDGDDLSPIGIIGELCIGGTTVAQGYRDIKHPDNAKFTYRDGERIYRTGDLARWLPDGNLQFIGRKDQQIKIHGQRIELQEIEAALCSHPGIEQAAVVSAKEANGSTVLRGFYVASVPIDVMDVRRFLLSKLPSYMVPSHLMPLYKIPLNMNGKLDRKILANYRCEIITPQERELPVTEEEKALVDIWRQILSMDSIDMEQSFFDLGGTSVTILHLYNRLNKLYDQAFQVVDLFSYHTPRMFLEFIHSQDTVSDQSIDYVVERLSAGKMTKAEALRALE